MKIYVSNLSSAVESKDLGALFAAYGEVTSAHVVMDIISGESRGFGYIEMNDTTAGQKAVEVLDQFEIDTLPVSVREEVA